MSHRTSWGLETQTIPKSKFTDVEYAEGVEMIPPGMDRPDAVAGDVYLDVHGYAVIPTTAKPKRLVAQLVRVFSDGRKPDATKKTWMVIPPTGNAASFDITANRWTEPGERWKVQILHDGGSGSLEIYDSTFVIVNEAKR